MRFSIFSKAEKLKNEVKLETETNDRAYFDIDGKKVCLVCNGKYTYIESCTCQHCSLHLPFCPQILCSYRIALIKYLGGEGNPQK